jgi:hypothetical protein
MTVDARMAEVLSSPLVQTFDELLQVDARLTELAQRVTVADGGFTIDPATLDDVTDGYAVSVNPEHERIYAEVTPGTIMSYMITNEAALAAPGALLGGWRDPADGRIYLDMPTLVHDREQALALARTHDELAVYDFAAGESIRTY